MKCANCGRKGVVHGCGENQPKFKKLIMLCGNCWNEWGKVWNQSRINILHGEEYHKAYYRLFWNWFNNSKESVTFT